MTRTAPAPSLAALPAPTSYRNSGDVYWAGGNSFAVALVNPAASPRPNSVWYTADGGAVHLASVNGIGEVRWLVNHGDVSGGAPANGATAVDYFGLTRGTEV